MRMACILVIVFTVSLQIPQSLAGNWVSHNPVLGVRLVRDEMPPLGRPERREAVSSRARNGSEMKNAGRVGFTSTQQPAVQQSELLATKFRNPLVWQNGARTLPLPRESRHTRDAVLRDHIHERSKGIRSVLYDRRFAIDSLDKTTSLSWFHTSKGKVSLHVLLGEGTYGKVYSGTLCEAIRACRSVAVKFQKPIGRPFNLPKGLPVNYAQIEHEYEMMKIMREVEGFAKPYTANFAGKWKYYVTDLLGMDIHAVSESYSFRVPFKVGIHLARQMLLRIRQLHEKGFVAQDIHSGNFVLDYSGTVYMIDLAFAFRWRLPDGSHIPDTESHFPARRGKRPPVATRREDQGLETSRADDLERLLYLILEMYGGALPWARIKDLTQYERLKSSLTDAPQKLCERMKMPWLSPLFVAVFKLGFKDDPPYTSIDKFLVRLSHRRDLASFRR